VSYLHQATGLEVPQVGPIELPAPTGPVSRSDVRHMLTDLLIDAGLVIGGSDNEAVEWLSGQDWATVRTVASWIVRGQFVALTSQKESTNVNEEQR
jgi:hypothetical protein